MSNGPLNAFVLMPFDSAFDEVWTILRKPLEEAGYQVRRADTDPGQGNVLQDIIPRIATADLVVADLTGANANVFYELGLSHALAVPTILIAQSYDQVPFDLHTYRVEKYSTGYQGAQEFQAKLRETAKRHSEGELPVGSPVLDYLPNDAKDLQQLRRKRNPRSVVADPTDPAAGAIDAILGTIRKPLNDTLGLFGELLSHWSEFQEPFEEKLDRLHTLNSEEGESSKAAAHQLAAELAPELARFSEHLASTAPELDSRTRRLSEVASALSTALEPEFGPETRQNLIALQAGMTSAHQAATNSLQGIGVVRQQLADMPEVDQALNNAVARTVDELDAVSYPFLTLQAFALRTAGLLSERLGPIDPAEYSEPEPAASE